MALFDGYLMVDWSAANVPKRRKDSIWIAYGERTKDGWQLRWNRNAPTRSHAVDLVTETMVSCLDRGKRLMAGFDFAFGYPERAAERMVGGHADWRSVWSFLADEITDDRSNRSNRFAVAAKLNGKLGTGSGARFWGNGTKTQHEGLLRTKAGFSAGTVSERRHIETVLRGAKSVWQLVGAGAVGSQSLVGIPALERLRRNPKLADHIAVWPFETRFAEDLGRPIIVTEIYPSLMPVERKPSESCLDEAQVRTAVETFAALDVANDLTRHLARPDAVRDETIAAVLREEGWIVGATTLARACPAASAAAPPRSTFDYIRNPAEIYRQSFATIEREADLSNLPGSLHPFAVRLIHACGMVDLVDDLAFSGDAVEVGKRALEVGAPIFCDVEMVRHGIIGRRLPAGNEIVCMLNDSRVPAMAERMGTTRSAAQVDLWTERLGGAVVAIGNAPTALFRLLELIDGGAAKPALIIGMPVGFVGAAESKAELAADPRGVPFVTVKGRRGGSAMAAAAVNALAGGLA